MKGFGDQRHGHEEDRHHHVQAKLAIAHVVIFLGAQRSHDHPHRHDVGLRLRAKASELGNVNGDKVTDVEPEARESQQVAMPPRVGVQDREGSDDSLDAHKAEV